MTICLILKNLFISFVLFRTFGQYHLQDIKGVSLRKNSSSKPHSSPFGRMRNARLRAFRTAISRRNRNLLSLFRQMTHQRKIGIFTSKRVSQHNVFRGFLDTNNLHIDLQPTVCQKRQARRRALFALGLTGKGSRSPKRHTQESKIRCS